MRILKLGPQHILKITSGDESETANLIPMDKLGALLTEMHELKPVISTKLRTSYRGFLQCL